MPLASAKAVPGYKNTPERNSGMSKRPGDTLDFHYNMKVSSVTVQTQGILNVCRSFGVRANYTDQGSKKYFHIIERKHCLASINILDFIH